MAEETNQTATAATVTTEQQTIDSNQAMTDLKAVTSPDVYENSFQSAFPMTEEETAPHKEEVKTEPGIPTEEVKEEIKDETKTEEEQKPADDFDLSLLDKKLKRFDEELTVKEWIKKYGDEAPEIIQKGWNAEEKVKFANEQLAKVKEEQEGISQLVLQNLAYKVQMPIRTQEDFRNELNKDGEFKYESVEDADKAFATYSTEQANSITAYNNLKMTGGTENSIMINNFQKDNPDIPLDKLMADIQPYLNASVSEGLTPFPKDALKVFWTGKNHDKILEQKVKDAREDERKKVYAEIETQTKTTQATSQKSNPVTDYSNLDPAEQQFQELFDDVINK